MRNSSNLHIPSVLIWAVLVALAQVKSAEPDRSTTDVLVNLKPWDDFGQRAAEIIQIVRRSDNPCRMSEVALTGNAHIPLFVNNQRTVSPNHYQWERNWPKMVPIPNESFAITPALNGAEHSIRVTISGDRSNIQSCQAYVINQVNALSKKPSIT